ncbi:helix-turn-helix domain-containing protein [Arthrobacter sp. PAMC25284]|uniref:helix-turn-helix domain-containing protein n=1 Tax=Arthrobacter sp. PAMC25284 TaxID=2861279 RepID=UPI0035C11E19
MTTAEAADFLGKPESTVRSYRWRGSGHGRLRSIRLDRAVRIYRSDVEQYKQDLDGQTARRNTSTASPTMIIPTPNERTHA